MRCCVRGKVVKWCERREVVRCGHCGPQKVLKLCHGWSSVLLLSVASNSS